MAATAAPLDLSGVPFLPGYGYKRRLPKYHRHQSLNVVNGVRVEQEEGVTFERTKLVEVPVKPDGRRTGLTGETTTYDSYKPAKALGVTLQPAWDALDRVVLRFHGYYKEAVVEANLENFRVRSCTILYYLEDDTCHIIEKKQDNSGIPQGQLVRRHRFPGPDGGYLSWQDLQVGSLLNIYGRNIVVVDCDQFTRAFCSQHGQEQAAPLSVEGDAFSASQGSTAKPEGPFGIPRTYERMYREAMLGGGHINADMQQFLENDRKVCRFYAVVDDVTLPQFERRPFVILFFLADDTVEIREQYPLNCGRDNFPIYYRRKKMTRGSVKVRGPLDQAVDKKDYVSVEDFAVGQVSELMGQKFFIYDADSFTRQYFREALQHELDEAKDVRLPERTVPRAKTPPYTGYGSWEDSLGSVNMLMPKPPKRDLVKLFANEGKVLRFTACFANAKPEDLDRLFVVNYNLADDTVTIHEPPVRNQGIVTGKFLEKGVHLNQITGELFKPEDLRPGNTIKVYNREFEILDMDEFTRNYLRDPSKSRTYDLQAVLEKLREGLRQQFPLVRDIFRRFDADHDGVLTLAEFKQALEKWNFQLAEEDVIVLMKHFDKRQDGQIGYNEFCDALLDEDYTTQMMKTKPPLKKDFDPEYADRAKRRVEERAETEKVRTAVRAVGDVVYKHTQTFNRLFKEFARMTHEETVTSEQVLRALNQFGHSFSLEDVERCVLYLLPGVDLKHINYVDFLKSIVTSFHDVSGMR